jgi:hypothetical protein
MAIGLGGGTRGPAEIELQIPKIRRGSYFPSFLQPGDDHRAFYPNSQLPGWPAGAYIRTTALITRPCSASCAASSSWSRS